MNIERTLFEQTTYPVLLLHSIWEKFLGHLNIAKYEQINKNSKLAQKEKVEQVHISH